MRTGKENKLNKLGSPGTEVKDTKKLLQASVNSTFYIGGDNYAVSARFIRLADDNQATVHIRDTEGDEYFGRLESVQSAFDHATDLDIFIQKGSYYFVWEKQVYAHDLPTEIMGHPLPPLTPEAGVENDLALFAYKRALVHVDDTADYILYRVLYKLPGEQSVFVVRTFGNKVYTKFGSTEALEARVVPGDFYTYHPNNDLLWQVHGISRNNQGFISPVASPIHLEFNG